MVSGRDEEGMIREGYHRCPGCGHEFYCDKRQVGQGRRGRAVQIGPNHHAIMDLFEKYSTRPFTNRDIQYMLTDNKTPHAGRRHGWSIMAVQDVISDLVGQDFVTMRRAEKGPEHIFRFKNSLDPSFNGLLLPKNDETE